jgi:hypothetical protein
VPVAELVAEEEDEVTVLSETPGQAKIQAFMVFISSEPGIMSPG